MSNNKDAIEQILKDQVSLYLHSWSSFHETIPKDETVSVTLISYKYFLQSLAYVDISLNQCCIPIMNDASKEWEALQFYIVWVLT